VGYRQTVPCTALTGDQCVPCTNKPGNSTYTSNTTLGGNCSWACNEGFVLSGTRCVVPAEPVTEAVPLLADLSINETFAKVCNNVTYYVSAFCAQARLANPFVPLNCTAQSIDGRECVDGVWSCALGARRLLQSSNSTSLVTRVDFSEPVIVVLDTIRFSWLYTIDVKPLRKASASDDMMLFLIAGAAGGAVVIGLVVGLTVYFVLKAKKKKGGKADAKQQKPLIKTTAPPPPSKKQTVSTPKPKKVGLQLANLL